jgi:cytochrome P450
VGQADLSLETLNGLANGGEPNEIDFVNSVSAPVPLAVLAKLLGVPREDWKLMFDWTRAIIGSSDPEYQQGGGVRQSAEASRRQLFAYFWKMTEERRKKPRDDIASVLANAEIDGAQLPPRELLSYFFLFVVAGNETTRNAMSGGPLALIQNPESFDKLCKDPTLADSAVEEVFEDPFEFRFDRQAKRHLAFGIGGYFGLGVNLARLELRVLFRQLAERMQEAELTGDVERLASSFLGGVKHMPIRHLITPASSLS